MSLCVYENLPAPEGRQEKEMQIYRLLQENNIPFCRVDHAPAATMEDCLAVDRALNVTMCKNLFLCNRQETQFYLYLVPGEARFSSKEFAQKMSIARVSFASETYMLEYLNILPGAVSPMGLIFDTNKHIQLVIDRRIAEAEFIGCHPCVNTASLRMTTKDFFQKWLPLSGHDFVVID